jgi:hypothetical protein
MHGKGHYYANTPPNDGYEATYNPNLEKLTRCIPVPAPDVTLTLTALFEVDFALLGEGGAPGITIRGLARASGAGIEAPFPPPHSTLAPRLPPLEPR